MAEEVREPINRFLAALGVASLVVATVGFFLDRSEALAGGFLVAGVFLCAASVMAPRMEGSQKVGLTGAEFNLARLQQVIQQAENEVRTEKLPEIEEIVDGR